MKNMRKSRYVSLLLAGAAVTALAACDQNNTNTGETEGTLYGDATSCAQDFDAAACSTAFETAKAEHVQQAPKFASVAECEAAGYNACEPTPPSTASATPGTGTSGGTFMPIMMGYMMGRMMGGGMMPGTMSPNTAPNPTAGAAGTTPAKSAWSGTTRPVYANRDGYLFAGGNNVGRVAPGATSLGSTGVPMRTAARGGFGGSASRLSGGGS